METTKQSFMILSRRLECIWHFHFIISLRRCHEECEERRIRIFKQGAYLKLSNFTLVFLYEDEKSVSNIE